jgi:molybdenum cofactor cytidylyltransferase
MVSPPRLHAILLAAGESRRMGYPKPLLKVGDETFLARSVNLMLDVATRVVVVLGAHADRIGAAVPNDARVSMVHNPHFERGQLSSLKIGLSHVAAGHADAVLVHLADHPLVAPATFRAIVDEHFRSGYPIVIARHHGHRGHPVIFARALFNELANAAEDQGARVIVNADPARVAYVDVEDAGVVLDLDTPDELFRAGLPLPPRES